MTAARRVYSLFARPYLTCDTSFRDIMRAEIESLAEDAKQAIGLLRRHL
jgi:hypothetical protein